MPACLRMQEPPLKRKERNPSEIGVCHTLSYLTLSKVSKGAMGVQT
jgi:hypothetical protein